MKSLRRAIAVGLVSVWASTAPSAHGTPAAGSGPAGSVDRPTAASVAAELAVDGVSPNQGPVSGGTEVLITGTGFGCVVSVRFGESDPARATVVSPTSVRAIVPAHGPGAVDLVVTSDGTRAVVRAAFSYLDQPTIGTIAPASGPRTGGTRLLVTGTGFTPDTTVAVGGVPATGIDVAGPTELSAVTPPGAVGTADVVVSTPGGTATRRAGFAYLDDQPTLTAIQPSSGGMGGGTTVTATGTGFTNDAVVLVDGVALASSAVSVIDRRTLRFVTPAHAAGPVAIRIRTAGGTSDPAPSGFTYLDYSPTASSLTPALGPAAGGTAVTISGTGFVPGHTSVSIGGIDVPSSAVTVASDTSLSFIAPAHSPGAVAVFVTTHEGRSQAVPGGYTYVAAPTTSSLSPTSGPVAGGTSITITGAGFVAGETSVSIGGTTVPPASVTVTGSSSATFLAPPRAAGNVTVSVSTAGGTSANVPGGFTYLAAPNAVSLAPASGPTSGGTTVTVTGSGFVAGATTVTIGGTTVPASSVAVASETSLSFSTPPSLAGNAAVSVSTAGGTSANVPGGFTYLTSPTAAGITPSSGPPAGGTSVTVGGSGFVVGNTSVTIGGVVIPAAAVSVTSTSSLSFITPAHAAGNVSVSVTTPGGTSSAVPGGFTYVAAPTAASLSPSSGPSAGGTSVTVTGSGFVAGATSVTVGGVAVPAGSVTVSSSTSLTVVTPANAPGTVAVTVTTVDGTSDPVPGGFTYVAAPTAASLSPSSGPSAGGTSVTVTGSGFVGGATSVTAGGVAVPAGAVTVFSPTALSFPTPSATAGTVAVTVSTV
ncbi:IPT/TIG domain-containing protein, partial [Nocardioides sp. R-C-SC26]|uniref:IPT/TIG domain-containing protein n=1 Tax=Nocardioides sp. R-C-SC26 TaxID=2870414 RepID=UPI001E5AF8CD